MEETQLDIFDFLYANKPLDKNKPIRLFEAFSGYGSQQMALKRLGVKLDVVGYSEVDKYAIKVYEKIHGKHKNFGGIGSFESLPKDIDICTWSFPCQDISLAGNQKGMVDGSRSNYGYTFLDTVLNTPKEERPKVLLMENVKALYSEKFKNDWFEIQKRLEEMGYLNYADILNAKDYNVAQNRERVFIVSILGGGNYSFPKPTQLEKQLKDYLEDEVDEKYYLTEEQLKQIMSWNSYQNPLESMKNKDDTYLQTIAAKSNTSMNASMILIAEETKNYFKLKEEDRQRHRIYKEESVGFTITTKQSQQPLIAIKEKTKKGYAEATLGDGVYINRPHQKRGVVQKGLIQTLKTSPSDVGVVVEKDDFIWIRKLTPREALRSMDVEEKDIDTILDTVSDTQAYKLAGNSIVVNVLVEIFKGLF